MALKWPIARGLRGIVDALQRDLFEPPRVPVDAARPPLRRGVEPSGEPSGRREVLLEARRVAFVLKRTPRRSIGFAIGADGLVVSAPRRLALRDIDSAVQDRSRWIVAKLDEQQRRSAEREANRMVWCNGAEVMHLGRPIRIVVETVSGRACGKARLDDEASTEASAAPRPQSLRIGLPGDAKPEQLRDAVQGWLKREALAVFEARCRLFAPRLGVEVKRLSLSSAATRWGSASADGSIRLHWRLVHLPMATLDYVVVHELAHLREMNHRARFWALVGSVVPDYREQRKRLRLSETRPLG